MSDNQTVPGDATSPSSPWLHRFALLVVLATFALIVVGGNVTSKGAGMAVPDWPRSFGSFNPDGWTTDMGGTVPGVRAEHGHRLLGATVGMLVTALAIWIWRADPRAWVRRLGLFAWIAVVVQGVMGGLRVTEISITLAIIHGCFAQAFLCLLVVLATVTSPSWPKRLVRQDGGPADRLLRVWTLALPAAVYVQLILGAIYRHTGTGIIPHIAGALIVGMVLMQASQQVFRRPVQIDGGLSRWTIGIYFLLAIQVILGVMTFVLVSPIHAESSTRTPGGLATAYLPTLHVGLGAVILAVCIHLAMRAQAVAGHGETGTSSESLQGALA